MLPRIETSDVIRRTMKVFEEHNAKCPLVTHTRNTKAGPVEVTRRQGIVPEAVTTTFHVILTKYILNYNALRRALPADMQDTQKLPPVWTNAVRLGKLARCTDRTVRNHLDVLKGLGLLTTKFHGHKRNFELWISQELLLGPENAPIPLSTAESAPEEHQRKIFPDTDSSQSNLIKPDTGQADLCIKYGESHTEKTDRQPGENPASLPTPEEHRERYSAAGAAARRAAIAADNAKKQREKASLWLDQLKTQSHQEQEIQPELPQMPDGRPVTYHFARMLITFWAYAKSELYKTIIFKKDQEERALVAIMAGVYGDFRQNRTEEAWTRFQVDQLEKISKVSAYLDRHPNAYVPFPYAVNKPGCGYFDRENINGFAGVDAWLKDDKARSAKRKKIRQINRDKDLETMLMAQQTQQREAMLETMLRRAAMDFERLERGARARKEVEGMGILSLTQHHSSIFAGYGRKWQNLFLRQVEAHRARGFKPEETLAARRRRRPAPSEKTTVVYITPDMIDDGEGYYVD